MILTLPKKPTSNTKSSQHIYKPTPTESHLHVTGLKPAGIVLSGDHSSRSLLLKRNTLSMSGRLLSNISRTTSSSISRNPQSSRDWHGGGGGSGRNDNSRNTDLDSGLPGIPRFQRIGEEILNSRNLEKKVGLGIGGVEIPRKP